MNPQFLDLPLDSALKRAQRRRENPLFFAPLMFCSATLLLPGAVSHAQNAEVVLDLVRAGEAKAQLRATQIVQRGSSREVATLYRSGLKRRLEWRGPGVKAGDILIDDGETLTLFHAAEKTATQTQSARRAPVLAAGNWRVGAPQTLDGRAVRVLSRGNGRDFTIDAKTGVILKRKNAGTTTTLQGVQYGAVPAAKFQFAAPAGTRILRTDGRLLADLGAAKRLASWLQAPAQVPGGYAFESAVAGKKEVWLRYSNGKKRFSLFQQPTSDADLEPQRVDGGWFWRKGGLRFVASGAPDEAIATLSK